MPMNTLVGFFTLAVAVSGQHDAPVRVEDEPDHRTVLTNDYIQAFRVTLEPGTSTRMHTHAYDDIAVRLSRATGTAERPGEPAGPAETRDAGFVSARDNEGKPLTHRVRNVGDTVYDLIDVQVLVSPPGSSAPALSPPAAENRKMRAYRHELAPGESKAAHVHARPFLFVAATDTDLQVTSPDGVSTRRDYKAGDMQWVDSGETHVLTNVGTAKAIVVELELK